VGSRLWAVSMASMAAWNLGSSEGDMGEAIIRVCGRVRLL